MNAKTTLAFSSQAKLDSWRASSDSEAGYPKNIVRSSDGTDMAATWGQTITASGDVPLEDDGRPDEAGAVIREAEAPAAPLRWAGSPLRREAALGLDGGPLALDGLTFYLE